MRQLPGLASQICDQGYGYGGEGELEGQLHDPHHERMAEGMAAARLMEDYTYDSPPETNCRWRAHAGGLPSLAAGKPSIHVDPRASRPRAAGAPRVRGKRAGDRGLAGDMGGRFRYREDVEAVVPSIRCPTCGGPREWKGFPSFAEGAECGFWRAARTTVFSYD